MQRIDLLKQDNEIWELFTRKEEYDRCSRDRHDRFPYYRSRHRDISVPRASKVLIEKGYYCEYPEAQPFAICLTHDIDTVYKPFHSKGFEIISALKRGDLAQVGCIVPQLCSKKRPGWNFNKITDLEESYGACSSFYFMALEKGDRGYTYTIEDLEQEICMLLDKGWEIGLHGGCEAYRDLERLQREKRRLEKVLNRTVNGYRNHFLKFRVRTPGNCWSERGFGMTPLLDTRTASVSERDVPPVPAVQHKYRPGDEILESLVVMDQTLLSAHAVGRGGRPGSRRSVFSTPSNDITVYHHPLA